MMVTGMDVSRYFNGTVWLVVVVTVMSGLHYLYRGIRRLNGDLI